MNGSKPCCDQNYGLAGLGRWLCAEGEKELLRGNEGTFFPRLGERLIRQTFDATFDGFRTLNISYRQQELIIICDCVDTTTNNKIFMFRKRKISFSKSFSSLLSRFAPFLLQFRCFVAFTIAVLLSIWWRIALHILLSARFRLPQEVPFDPTQRLSELATVGSSFSL